MITVDKTLELANQLSLIDKIHLIEQLAAQLVQELPTQEPEKLLAEGEDHRWSQFSLQMALHGMEEEATDDYTLADVQEFFTPRLVAADPAARRSTDATMR